MTTLTMALAASSDAGSGGLDWSNLWSALIGSGITGLLGFVALQRQFREQTRQRKQGIYAAFLAELHNFVNVTNRLVFRAFREAERQNIATYLTNDLPELFEAKRSVNVQMAALAFMAPLDLQRRAARFLLSLNVESYFNEMAERLQVVQNMSAAEVILQQRGWGEGPQRSQLEKAMQDDAGAPRRREAALLEARRNPLKMMQGQKA